MHLPRLPTATPGEHSWPSATIYLSGGRYLVAGRVQTRGPLCMTFPIRNVSGDAGPRELGQAVLDSFGEYRRVEEANCRELPNAYDEMLKLGGYHSDLAFRRETLLVSVRCLNEFQAKLNPHTTQLSRGVGAFSGVEGSAMPVVSIEAEAVGWGVLDTMLLSRLEGFTAEQSMAKVRPEPPIQDIPTPTAAMYRTGGQYLIAGDIAVAGGSRRMTTPICVLQDDATPTELGQAALDSFESFRVESGDGSEHPDGYRELKKLTGHSSDVAFRRETLMIRLHSTHNTVRLTAALTETKQGKAGFVNFEDLPARLPLEAETLGQGMLDTLQLARFRGFTPEESIAKLER